MKNKYLPFLLFFTCLGTTAFSQKKTNQEFVLWDSDNKPTINDFIFKKSDSTHNFCNAVFIMEYYKAPFSFKPLNKQFTNSMLKSASWIDTALNISYQITYLQTLFDIQEIYTRQWRKAFSEKTSASRQNLKKTQNKVIADAINRQQQYRADIMSAGAATSNPIQAKWEEAIQIELKQLEDFSYKKRGY